MLSAPVRLTILLMYAIIINAYLLAVVLLKSRTTRSHIYKEERKTMRNYLLDRMNGDRVFFTDGCNDLTKTERIQYGIWENVAPINITVDGKDIDFSDIDTFYENEKNGRYTPTGISTASPNPSVVLDLLFEIDRCVPDYVTIYYLAAPATISSGVNNSHQLAIREFCEARPLRKIVTIETNCASNGTALASQYIASYSGDDIEEYATFICDRMMHLFTLRKLDFCAESGRFNALQRVALGAIERLHVSPNMIFPSRTQLAPVGVARGDLVLNEWVNYYLQHRPDETTPVRIGYGHSDEETRARKLTSKLEAVGVPAEQIQLARVGSIIGAHTGPTVLSVFFLQKDSRPQTKNDYQKPLKR